MVEETQQTVNLCTCNICGWKWRSLTVPIMCPNPSCRTKRWNGSKPLGRPKLAPEAKKKPARPRNTRAHRATLPEYQEDARW